MNSVDVIEGSNQPVKFLIIIRSFLAAGVTLLLTFMTSSLVIFSALILRRMDWADTLVRTWGRLNLWLYNIDVTLEGEENLPKGGCLFVFNHSSHFDIIVLTAVMSKAARFGAKAELFKIPIFGHALRALGSLPIFRTDRERVFKLYEESIARVHNGESFYLAAEGTRHHEPGVGPRFKAGPFVFAINGQFPIVPVVIKGAAECLPKGKLMACTKSWESQIRVRILPPLSTKDLTLEHRQNLISQAHNLMTTAYEKL